MNRLYWLGCMARLSTADYNSRIRRNTAHSLSLPGEPLLDERIPALVRFAVLFDSYMKLRGYKLQ